MASTSAGTSQGDKTKLGPVEVQTPLTFDPSSSSEEDYDLVVDEDQDDNSSMVKARKRAKKSSQQSSQSDNNGEQEPNVDERVMKNRLSAKECRIRKKLRYQYLAELIVHSEEAVFKLRDELKQLEKQCKEIDEKNSSANSQ